MPVEGLVGRNMEGRGGNIPSLEPSLRLTKYSLNSAGRVGVSTA